MNLLILFDYIFYRIAFFYSKTPGFSETKRLGGIIFLSLLQAFNIMAVLSFIDHNNGNQIIKALFAPVLIVVYIIVLILNYIRYIKLIPFEKFEEKWGEEKLIIKIIRSSLIVGYVFFTLHALS